VGGGFELALACNLRVASETARFGLPEARIGVMPAAGGTQRLPRLIGPAPAKELLFTGRFMDAREALRLGVVNRVVPVEDLMGETLSLAEQIAANPPLSVAFCKQAVNVGLRLDLKSALDYEAHCASLLYTTEDRREGMMAFLEKRKPVFRGR